MGRGRGVGVLTKTSAALWSGAEPPRRPAAWARLDVRVAVRLDSETLLASVGQDVSESGQQCLVNEAWEIFETEPRELGSALAEVHLWLCQVHDRVPLELAGWLAKLVGGMLAGRPVWTCRRGMPTFWAWRDWSSSRRYVTGRFDDGARTAAFQRP
jgi:hypothetical protein